jgi:SAM-dependent methyltransferase
MNGGREKNGDVSINWQEFAFGLQKYRRKTIAFGAKDKTVKKGHSDEVYIRELSITEAGIGCAIWDASIIISRCLEYYGKQESEEGKIQNLWENERVIELGAGVGLPGIVCSRFARECVITDCIPKLIDNIRYNVRLNSDSDNSLNPEYAMRVQEAARVEMLDWHEVSDEGVFKEKFDVVFGSELVYTGDVEHIQCLIDVVDRLLKSDGVFYSIQSTDRDGMAVFTALLRESGFEVTALPVPERFLGNYGTKQLPETYKFYTVWKSGIEINYPVFGTEI